MSAGPPPEPDAVAGVRARVDEAYAAADRLVREAEAAARQAAAEVPRHGWDVPRPPRAPDALPDLAPLLTLLEAMRHAVPPDLMQRLAEALRELLLAVRALLDWWIERTERRAEGPVEVQDIPID
jgi:hypothetical protein